MKSNASRANETIDDAVNRTVGRQVCIVNGPVVMEAPHTSEGQRRFVVVAGTVVLEGGNAVRAHAEPPRVHRHTPVEHRRAAFAELAVRR